MAFGSGIYEEVFHRGEVKREQRGRFQNVAVKCWFTSAGKSMPLMMKFKDSQEQIHQVEDIRVLTCEKTRYAGVSVWEYHCSTVIEDMEYPFVLLFHPEDCEWKMRIPE